MDTSQDALPAPEPSSEEKKSKNSLTVILLVIVGILLLGGLIFAVVALLQPNAPTARIRDIFIIFMAFESLLIGIALIILIVQIAALINLLQNEVKPILDATNETVHTLRGTTLFLSENMVEPVIKLNTYLAGLQRMLELFGRKK
jgi:hypothetical protein